MGPNYDGIKMKNRFRKSLKPRILLYTPTFLHIPLLQIHDISKVPLVLIY